MSSGSFAEYLAGLSEPALVELLAAHPEVRIEPAPRNFEQLAQRLSLPDSLGSALRLLTLAQCTVGRAIAALGSDATETNVAGLLAAPESTVEQVVASLCRIGLAWPALGTLALPKLLVNHWTAELGGGQSAAALASSMPVAELRVTATALGANPAAPTKPELIKQITTTMSDPTAMITLIKALPAPAKRLLDLLRSVYAHEYLEPFDDLGAADPAEMLIQTGLALRHYGTVEIFREVAIAGWLADQPAHPLTRPQLPPAAADEPQARRAALASAEELLRAATTLLDEAATTPITGLKKGGVGTRERTRLATRMAIAPPLLMLCIDLTYQAGLLAETDTATGTGYAPTSSYPAWRDAGPSHRWADLVYRWFQLDFAPTYRTIEDDKELPPPLPLASAAGLIRRALLLATRSGASSRAAGREIDWFSPLHGYPAEERDHRVDATIREAELLGVLGADRLSELGEHLLAVIKADPDDPIAELAGRCAPLLPHTSCTVILQSDLTAVVSGQPSTAVVALLTLAAQSEARGTADVWRFTPASIRAALDSGRQAEGLRSELTSISGRPLPQPLEYLITDVARRHGGIRARGLRSCLIADETMITELLHTRALAKLQLAQLAPTVLSSPKDVDGLLTTLRAAGFLPIAEDATGTVIVETRPTHLADDEARTTLRRPRRRHSAAELAGRLRSESGADATTS
jgi:hypothetical protein